MAQNDGDSELDPKHEQLIWALLNSDTQAEAARKTGMSRRTVNRCLKDPAFKSAYRQALRTVFNDALAGLQKGAVKAVRALINETDLATASLEPTVISACNSILAKAFHALDAIKIEEELAEYREVVESLKAAQAENLKPPEPRKSMAMSEEESTEAARLRMAWMGEMEFDAESIDASLRFNRPQSLAEERYLLDLVRKLLEAERQVLPTE